MSLPIEWVQRIFSKLTLAYGRDFLGRWEGIDLVEVHADWSHELSGFEAHPEAIAYALAHLPIKPPTVLEFRAIARLAPPPPVPRLEAPRADPQRVAEALQRLGPILQGTSTRGGKDWAHVIVNRAMSGERVTPNSLRVAREALGLHSKGQS
ncbi:hypothetical protein [Acidovorax sp. Root219]|uniref:hypothetical protein n=1 Tax=Acidovorax sp. Root219 TaxID=1736493 RepID=UPI000709B78E|nr:hypothetical protein [Acidovorax sp. Root219]KRC36255.1 hypothetical protein ASE28_01600 [Acidovorax sp. Root219]